MQVDPNEEARLFEAAIEIEDPELRRRFLDENCFDNSPLRRSVEALLRFDESDGTFLETPARLPANTAPAYRSGDRIGNYQLVECLGEGGFGVVWMARQHEPVSREVALKIIKLKMDTEFVNNRFNAERQSLAMMSHPGIATVLDVGNTDRGRPYFVMEWVRGSNLADYADQKRLAIRERLGLFLEVCQAVAHAHQKGVVHCDLKPSNVLVADDGTGPRPKIIDFGISRIVTGSDLTDTDASPELIVNSGKSSPMGSPAYASPEQLLGEFDTRTDVYGLGAVLYRLLVGVPPVKKRLAHQHDWDEPSAPMDHVVVSPSKWLPSASNGDEIARQRRSNPRKLIKQLRGDLDWITSKALQIKPDDRYASVVDLQRDVERHLKMKTISAAPASSWDALRRGIRRNRLAVIAGSGILIASLIGTAVSTAAFFRAEAARRGMQHEWSRAEHQRDLAEQATLRAKLEAEKAMKVASTLEEMLRFADPASGWPADFTLREQIDAHESRLPNKLSDYPLMEARIRSTLGRIYLSLHEIPKAGPNLSRALQIRQETLADHDPRVLESQVDYGWYLLRSGQYAQADQLLSSTLPILREQPSDALLSALEAISRLRRLQNDIAGRNQSTVAAWEYSRQLHGDDHPTTARYQARAARIEMNHRRFDTAQEMCEEALRRVRKVHAQDHPDVAAIELELARSHFQQKEYADAERFGRSALAMNRKLLGDDSIMVLASKVFLINVLHAQSNRVPEAFALAREAARQADRHRVKAGGDEYFRLAAYQWATRLAGPQNARLAKESAEKALEIMRRIPAKDGFLKPLRELGFALRRSSNLDAAAECYETAVKARESIEWAHRRGEQFATLIHFAELEIERGNEEEGLKYLDQATQIEISDETPKRRLLQVLARGDQAALLARLQRVSELKNQVAELDSLAAFRAPNPPMQSWLDESLHGHLLAAAGKYTEAIERFLEAESAVRSSRNNLMTQRAQTWQAHCLAMLDDFPASETLLLGVVEQQSRSRTSLGQLIHRRTVLELIKLYKQWQKPKETKQWQDALGASSAAVEFTGGGQ
ncbi:MAG: serine/threonine-protein kinase [Planctomycetota bacterium]